MALNKRTPATERPINITVLFTDEGVMKYPKTKTTATATLIIRSLLL